MTLECCRCLQFCTNIFVINEHTTNKQTNNQHYGGQSMGSSLHSGFVGTLNKPQLN